MTAELNDDLSPEFCAASAPCDPARWSSDVAQSPKVGQAYDANGFIWRASRLELLGELKTTWLSTTPERPSKGEPAAWDSSPFCRTMVEGRFRDRQTGHILHAISVHLDHHGKRARVESARLTMARAHQALADGRTVIVGGDFNTFPEPSAHGPQTYAALAEAARASGFVDVRGAAAQHVDFGVGEDSWKGWPAAKFCRAENRANFPQPAPGQDASRFDHLFVQDGGGAVRFTGVVEEAAWAPASDHVPIVAELEVV